MQGGKVYLAGEEKGTGDLVIGEGSIVEGDLRSGGEARENPRSRKLMVMVPERESSRWGIGEDGGKGEKSERGRHCRKRRRRRSSSSSRRRRIAKNKGKGMGMGMVNESLHLAI